MHSRSIAKIILVLGSLILGMSLFNDGGHDEGKAAAGVHLLPKLTRIDPAAAAVAGSLLGVDPIAPPPELCERLVAKGRSLESHLVQWANRITARCASAIIEGEGIHPAALAKCADGARICAVFLVEHEADRLHATLEGRSSTFRRFGKPRRWRWIDTLLLYKRWIESEARIHGQPCLASQPWETLPERILSVHFYTNLPGTL